MKLVEITAEEFRQKLKDPDIGQVHVWASKIEDAVNKAYNGDWKVEVVNPPEDFYADKFINIHRMTDYRPSTGVLYAVFNIAASIVAIPSLHDVKWGHDNKFVDVDIQLDIAFGREDLYKDYDPEQLERTRMHRG